MRSRPVYYVLLAAGLSRRFPGNKLLANLCGVPIVRAAAGVAAAAGLPLVVVTGNDRESVVRALSGIEFHEVINSSYASGLSSSVRAAISADMPLVPPEVPRLLAGIREDSPFPLIAPRYGGVRGHPVLLGRELYEDAASSIGGDSGLSQYIESRRELLLEVDVGSPGVVLDVDTPEDLERIRSLAGCGRPADQRL
ncbi:MAG: NTP transferase domain-containing protein [Nitrososphaeria archaeon]